MDNNKTPAHLLGLPLPVRHRIYKKSGVIWDRGRIWLTEGENPSSWDDKCTRNLLLTYKTMHAEISYMVYSNNQLVLKYKESHGLQPLRNLLPTSIECLSDVIILLNTSSCPDGVCCRMKCRVDLFPKWSLEVPTHTCLHDKPLQISSRPGEKVISEWRDTVQLLSRHLRPSQLKLQLICDVDDQETANSVVKPLLALPTLALCELRLGRHPVPTLKTLAVTAASQAMGGPLRKSTTAFPFLRLPVELANSNPGVYRSHCTPGGNRVESK